MRMEWVLAAAVVLCAAILFLVIKRTAQMCARTLFAPPYEPTQAELEAARTPCVLPEAAVELPDGLEQDVICAAAEHAARGWMQAVNDRDSGKLADIAAGLVQPFAELCDRQTARGERERFEQIQIHESVLTEAADDMLTVCVSAQAIHYLVCGGQVIRGREELPEQMVWELTGTPAAPIRFEHIRQIK